METNKDYSGWEGVLPPEQIQRMKELDLEEEELNRRSKLRTDKMLYRLEHLDAFLEEIKDIVIEYFEEAKKTNSELTVEVFYPELKRDLTTYFSFYKDGHTDKLPIEILKNIEVTEIKYSKIIYFGEENPYLAQPENNTSDATDSTGKTTSHILDKKQ